ncbi:protein src2 [Quercus suber]|uniref:Protein src2 n=1 Tax=Quercus suber TaxID=58331 RepID=A0AAW0KTX1_QUESU
MKPYAVVFIRDHNNILHSSERKTSVDSEGGSNPTWNFNLRRTVRLELVVKLKSHPKTHGLRDKDIGEVRVLILELLEGFGDDDHDAAKNEKHMSKSIIVTSDGEAQGALAFSYKFRRTVSVRHPPTDPNVKQRPKRGVNGSARPFVEGLEEGLSSGLMGVLGTVFFYDDDTPDDDNEDEYS